MGDSDPSWYQGAWSGWLKEFAPANILFMYVTLDTFQLLSGWLTVTPSFLRAKGRELDSKDYDVSILYLPYWYDLLLTALELA